MVPQEAPREAGKARPWEALCEKMSSVEPRVVIVGGGFGGLTVAQGLARAPVAVTLLDRANHHLFQPLLYQVATAGLSPAEIAIPIRQVLGRQRNVTVLLEEVTAIDLAARRVEVREGEPRGYDFLVVATGAKSSYFGHDEWEPHALGLKSLRDALAIRERVLMAFEEAERIEDPAARRRLLTFVVVGGGPTGVELAGALAELSRHVLARDFRNIDPGSTRVVLLEGSSLLLAPFGDELAAKGRAQLEELGVEVRTGTRVTAIDDRGVKIGTEALDAATVLWAAGVCATALTEGLGVELDRAGRVLVGDDCSIAGHPEAFVIGDAAHVAGADGQPLPGLAPIAIQQGRAVAASIVATIQGGPRRPFVYRDRGIMATIGRSRAVARTARLSFTGFTAWLTWLFVHILYLIGYRNRVLVLIDWFWSYVTFGRGARLITGRHGEALGPRPGATAD